MDLQTVIHGHTLQREKTISRDGSRAIPARVPQGRGRRCAAQSQGKDGSRVDRAWRARGLQDRRSGASDATTSTRRSRPAGSGRSWHPVGSGTPVLPKTVSQARRWSSADRHPPTRKARAAAMTAGPASSTLPSRSSRAGERSSSSGLRPWNHAWATWVPSASAIGRATWRARRSRCCTSALGWRLSSAH
jgi:hypothetical protein